MLVNKLEDMIITGENYRMEFKESVDKTFVEEATAFANASEGTILIGVRDNGTIKGTDTSNAAISRIQDSLMQIKPHIDVDIEIIKNVVSVHVAEQDEKYYLNNSGILFFAKKPTQFLSHAYVVCALFKGLDKEIVLDRKEFTGDILSNIEDTIIFLKKHLNLRYEIKSVRRKEILDIPEVALREAVINAHCHRDYFEKGAQIMVEIYDDRVVITNPGGVPKGIDANKFGKISITRNPNIASLLQRANYIEKMGTGISRITNAMQKVGLPLPSFELEGFFMVTLMRDSYIKRQNGDIVKDTDDDTDVTNDVTNVTNDVTNHSFNNDDLEIWILNMIKSNKHLSLSEISKIVNVTKRTVQRKVNKLKEDGIIKREGSSRSGSWVIIKNIGGNGHE
ncbi:MAG: winged helix-turn-helix transcriptional regulator [Clostridiaceae bacterium]|nr:winged helix-turn-helix transcriptional regulator [Clostridiaceae bacterium]